VMQMMLSRAAVESSSKTCTHTMGGVTDLNQSTCVPHAVSLSNPLKTMLHTL